MMGTRSAGSSSEVDEMELHAYVDGFLGKDRNAAVLTHLLTHGEDRERVEAYRRHEILLREVGEAMAASPPVTADEALDHALIDALNGQRDRSRRFFGGVAAMAAGLALAIGIGTAAWRHLPQSATVASLEQASPEFTFGGALAFYPDAQPASDGATSLGWLAGHMTGEKQLQIPDLEELGFHAVGGDVLRGTRSPAVHLVWSGEEGRQLHLFVGLVANGVEQAFTLVPEGHLSLHWRRGPLVFALVGAVDHPNLQQTVQVITAGMVREAAPNPAKEAGPTLPVTDTPQQAGGEAGPIQTVVRPHTPAAPGARPPVDGIKKGPGNSATEEITVAPVDMAAEPPKPL